MDLRTCKTLLLFGGTFDPPHVAHVVLPMQAARLVDADAVAYVPAGRPPHKAEQVQTPAHHRLAMLRLALETLPRAVVLSDEIARLADGQPSYTIDTLTALRRRLGPLTRLRLLVGGDQLAVFPTWKDADRIIELAEPLVMVRPPQTPGTLLDSLPDGYDADRWAGRLASLPQMDVSATRIRKLVAEGRSISGLVHPAVEDYIRRHGLYRVGNTA